MIKLEERTASKVPGLTSIFIKFNYNQLVIDTLRTIQGAQYNEKEKEWEIPILSLQYFLDCVAGIDDIDLYLLDSKCKYVVYTQPKDSDVKLFKHQEEAVSFGLSHDKWLLLDAPGLGKTLSLIRLAEELKKRDKINHCLIICGINSLKMNWLNEIKKFSSLSATILGQRITKRGTLRVDGIEKRVEHLSQPIEEFFVITNIETLRNDKIVQKLQKGKNKFDMVVVDEIHTCRSHGAKQTDNLLKVKAKYQVGATGTLLLNNVLDCFTSLKWIEAEHANYTNFRRYYCEYGGPFGKTLVGYKNTELLKYQLEQVSLRRKKDLLDLPPKSVITEYLEMEPKQANFYKNIIEGIVDQVDKVELMTTNLLAMVVRLRQATACPSILTTEDIPSVKVDRCIDLVEQILTDPEEKVVVFCAFKETANKVYEVLKEYNALLCTGDVREDLIESRKQLFQESNDFRVMVATMDKMGTGHTLNRAHYAIFIDQAWTDGNQTQCEDRIHRIGQNNKVFIYRLVTKDTFDERVIELLEDKKAIGDYIVDNEIPTAALDSLRKYILELR